MNRVTVTEVIKESDIRDLITGRTLALHVPAYCPIDLCERLSHLAEQTSDAIEYKHDVRKSDGTIEEQDYRITASMVPFTWVLTHTHDPDIEYTYFTSAKQFKDKLDQTSYPALNPLQRLMDDFDGVWPHPVRLAKWKEASLHAGLLRSTLPNASRLQDQPHVDSVPVLFNTIAQLSANIYLDVPKAGGELIVYDHEPAKSHDDAKNYEAALLKNWFNRIATTTIQPQTGDLVLINTRRYHAVKTFEEGRRNTANCFIGCDSNHHLNFWS